MFERQLICSSVCHALKNLKVPVEVLNEKNYHCELTGETFKLDGVSLCYLLFELENEYQIKIPEENLIDYQFNNINDVVEVVKSTILSCK